MKLNNLLLTGLLVAGITGSTFAGSNLEDSTATAKTYEKASVEAVEVVNVENEQEKKEVKLTALPVAITEALNNDKYAGWEAEKAFESKEGGVEIGRASCRERVEIMVVDEEIEKK